MRTAADELLKSGTAGRGDGLFYDTTGRITACRNEAYRQLAVRRLNLLDRRQERPQAGAGVVPFNRDNVIAGRITVTMNMAGGGKAGRNGRSTTAGTRSTG